MTKPMRIRANSSNSAYLDCDYFSKLTDDEKEFMINFLREYYGKPSQNQLRIHGAERGTELRRDANRRLRDAFQKADNSEFAEERCCTYLNPETYVIASEALRANIKRRLRF